MPSNLEGGGGMAVPQSGFNPLRQRQSRVPAPLQRRPTPRTPVGISTAANDIGRRRLEAGARMSATPQQNREMDFRAMGMKPGQSGDPNAYWWSERAQNFLSDGDAPTDEGVPPIDPGANPYGSGPGGGGGGGRGGGGGGSSASDAANFGAYQAAMQKMIGSDMFKGEQSLLKPMIDPAVDQDIATARSAYGNLAGQIPMNDPYLNLIAQQAPQLGDEMGAFLQGQGVGTGGADQAVQYANAQLQAGGQDWSNLAALLGQNHLAGQRGAMDVANLQGEGIVQGYEGQRTSLRAQAAMQQQQMDQAAKQQKMQAIMQMISAGLQYGQPIDLGSLLG